MNSEYPYCMSGHCYALTVSPWHNTGISHHLLEFYFSWIPLAGSAVGNIVGGLFADWWVSLSPNSAQWKRLTIAGMGCLLSAPLVTASFFMESPQCFLILIASGMLGELYLPQSLGKNFNNLIRIMILNRSFLFSCFKLYMCRGANTRRVS